MGLTGEKGRPPVKVGNVHPVGHQATFHGLETKRVDGRDFVFCCRRYNRRTILRGEQVWCQNQAAAGFARERPDDALYPGAFLNPGHHHFHRDR